jgi:hypothetical protein
MTFSLMALGPSPDRSRMGLAVSPDLLPGCVPLVAIPKVLTGGMGAQGGKRANLVFPRLVLVSDCRRGPVPKLLQLVSVAARAT